MNFQLFILVHLSVLSLESVPLGDIIFVYFLLGFIHDWGTKKECLIKKKLQTTTLNFYLSYIIKIVMDCCKPIDKIMTF
jgi:hypothetical protein